MSEESYWLEIPPSVEQIRAFINAESMSLKKAVAELVANAIDQDATKIDLSLNRKGGKFIVADNGLGCPNLEEMIKIGSHIPAGKGTIIGRFGVGFKDAVIWLGDEVVVDSRIGSGKRLSAYAPWQNMLAVKKWLVQFISDSARTNRGVTVTVTALRAKRFKSWNQVPAYIAELFSAAIDAGVTITVDGQAVKSIPDPLLEERVDFDGTHGALKFSGFCGILAERKSHISGWEIRYGRQTITTGYQKEGFNGYSAQGFYGQFNMMDGKAKWNLTRNKTDSEDLEEVLNCKYLQDIIRPILEKLRTRSENLTIKSNQLHVETFLTNLLQATKVKLMDEEDEERGDGKGTGGKKPRRRKKRILDEDSEIHDRIKHAQTLKIGRHQEPDIYGLGYVMVANGNKDLTIYIDDSTPVGKEIWISLPMLQHYAVMLLAQFCGLRQAAWVQLRLPLGSGANGQTEDERKISKALLHLLKSVEIVNSGVESAVA